ncbi:hypothetical protein LAG90_18700 [Marinilongibacter aquaticus]|uniref:hypothetical protein n=1 Tax=Marinilongibacter aquaticus TaxID=2975157 RepID=UPI0021BDDE6F|nr:hypothetical protein [Marinilongibacter aquaticus]UBM58829.1 hypothetical protein LAG90_18700 [Marinilongibacter aquaticus]
MKKYINTLVLFGSLAFLIMWIDRVVYAGEELKYNYFFLMFAIAGLLYYTYRRGLDKMKKDEEEKKNTKQKPKKR